MFIKRFSGVVTSIVEEDKESQFPVKLGVSDQSSRAEIEATKGIVEETLLNSDSKSSHRVTQTKS